MSCNEMHDHIISQGSNVNLVLPPWLTEIIIVDERQAFVNVKQDRGFL